MIGETMANELVLRAAGQRLPAKSSRALAWVEGDTLVRLAQVRGESLVQGEKLREIDYLAREAMSGHAFLKGWANHLAGENPLLIDELKFFKDTARLAKADILADTVVAFRRT
jgi:hypothetical protein